MCFPADISILFSFLCTSKTAIYQYNLDIFENKYKKYLSVWQCCSFNVSSCVSYSVYDFCYPLNVPQWSVTTL